MTSPVWITGLEHGVLSTNGGGLADSIIGTTSELNVVTGNAHSGLYSLFVSPTATLAARLVKNLSGSPNVVVGRFYIKITTAPTSSAYVHEVDVGVSASNPRIRLTSAGRFEVSAGGTSVALGDTFATNVWYSVDYKFDVSANPWDLRVKISGGIEFGGTFAQAADTFTAVRLGTASTTGGAYTAYIDDVVISVTSADYPIGIGGTQLLSPVSDGTHNAGVNIIESNLGVDIGVVSAWDLVDAVPLSSALTYIRQAANGAGNYAEVNFADITATHTGIIGAQGVLAYTSATTTANNGATVMSKDSFASNSSIWGTTTVPMDMSDGSLSALAYKSAVIAGVIDDTTVNALKARVGYSTDANPDPYWVNLAVEVAYVPSIIGNVSKTLGNLTKSLTGAVSIVGSISETLLNIIPDIDGSVTTFVINGSVSKSLANLTGVSNGQVSITGSVLKALGILDSNSSGSVSITGSASKVLANLQKSLSAGVLIQASSSSLLENLVSSSLAKALVQGTLTKILDDVELSSDAKVAISGSTSKTLQDINLSSLATVLVTGSANKTLQNAASLSQGKVLISGSLNETLANVTDSSETDVFVKGALAKILQDLLLDSEGKVLVSGSVSQTLGLVTLSTHDTVLITGNVVKTLGNVTLLSNGSVLIRGSVVKTLEDAFSKGLFATVNVTLQNLTGVIQGSVYDSPKILQQTFITNEILQNAAFINALENNLLITTSAVYVSEILTKKEASLMITKTKTGKKIL